MDTIVLLLPFISGSFRALFAVLASWEINRPRRLPCPQTVHTMLASVSQEIISLRSQILFFFASFSFLGNKTITGIILQFNKT
jgi:hypothetical protein